MKTAFKRITRSGFLNFKRNAFISATAILVMVITLSVILSTVFLSAVFSMAIEEIKDKVDVRVVFQVTATESRIMEMKSSLENLEQVSEVTYTNREAALASFLERREGDEVIKEVLAELGENPLGASLNIRAHDPSDYNRIALWIEGSEFNNRNDGIIDNINYIDNQTSIDQLITVMSSLERFGFLSVIILIFISILITFNTIRLTIYTSRDEISVMRLVGASTGYIRGPFVVAGILYGLVAAILTLTLFYPLTLWLGDTATGFFSGLNLFYYYVDNFGQLFLLVTLAGVIIGGISSYMAVKRYLRM